MAVGGGTADAVVLDARDRLLAQAEVATDDDLRPTVASALRQALAAPAVDPARVRRVMLGTGDRLARALSRREVERVVVVRIGAPLTTAVPPLAGWPQDLRDAVSAGEVVVSGGAEYDGRSAKLDEDAIARFLDTLDGGSRAVAITGVFSPLAPEQELAAAAVARRELGQDVRVSMSHELGTLGLIERENATVLNAALSRAAADMTADLEHALRQERIAAEPFLSCSDGALLALHVAQDLPVLMLDTGPADAMRGAVHLSGLDAAVVVNATGAAIEIGTVVRGFPKETRSRVEVAGVRLGFGMPEVTRLEPRASRRALVRAVARPAMDLSDPLVVAVGRGRERVPDRLVGMDDVLRPAAGELAAAIGAAIGEVTGRAETIAPDRPDRRESALEAARETAIALAVHAGADPDRLYVLAVDETPLTYDIDPMVRISVKVSGPPV